MNEDIRMILNMIRFIRQSLERLDDTELDEFADKILDEIFNEAEKIIYIVRSL